MDTKLLEQLMPHLKELIERCKQNDESAKRELFQTYASKIMGICRRYSNSSFESDDIFQETFIRIFNYLEKFDSEKGPFEAWIYRITVNEAIKYANKKSALKHSELEDLGAQEVDFSAISFDENLSAQELLELVQQLPPKQRIVFNMYVIEGYTHKEIAKELNVSEGTSKSNLHDARGHLARLYNQLYANEQAG